MQGQRRLQVGRPGLQGKELLQGQGRMPNRREESGTPEVRLWFELVHQGLILPPGPVLLAGPSIC
jgi:hypothetical protein